jgi:group I intron endonuclease
LVTGKCYVGSSVNLAGRLSIYYSKKAMLNKLSTRTSIIYSAILKHAYVNFSLDILEYCEIGVLIEREQYYLDHLKPEYNILKVANSRLGSKQSEATKIKISIGNKGKHMGTNNGLYGKMHTYETRKKIGISLRSIIRTNDTPKTIKLETRLKLSLRSQGVSVKVFDKSKMLIKYFGVSNKTVSKYSNKNKSYNGYTIICNIKNN